MNISGEDCSHPQHLKWEALPISRGPLMVGSPSLGGERPRVEAVLFDLHGTLAFLEEVPEEEASSFLRDRGYEVYPQPFNASWRLVGFVDYPRYGYRSWETFLRRVLERLGVKVDKQTLMELACLYRRAHWKLYPDAQEALSHVKRLKLKVGVVTSIAKFMYIEALKPVRNKMDFIVDSHTFKCEKSNPKIYLKTLEKLGVKPHQAVMVGDDLKLDVELPKKLGMKAILLDREGRYEWRDASKPDFIVNDLVQAVEYITDKYL